MSNINEKTKIPFYLVCSTLSLAVYGTVLYEKLVYEIDRSLSIQQAQQWIDNSREVNRVAFPGLIWPPIPPKPQFSFLQSTFAQVAP